MDKNYYTIMGVTPNATEQEIKTAYRRLARKYHPDISKETNAEEQFKEMGEAYETLKDPKKRAQYDQYRKNQELYENAQPGSNAQDKSYSQHTKPGFSGSEFDSEFFDSLFGHARQPRQPMKGHDYQGTINVSLEEAFNGTIKSIQVPSSEASTDKTMTLNVKIPAGVKSGQQIRLAGQGAPGVHGGPRGNIFLTVEVHKHRLFDIKDNDVYLTLPITPWEAALGTTIVVPTLSGKIDLKIPSGSQGGQKLRIKSRGLPGATAGDQYVLLKIYTPPATSDEAKELYKKMADTMPFNPRESLGVNA
jgi:curved DNA-binding protein